MHCTVCVRSGSRSGPSRRGVAWVAPGIGTATPGRASTPRVIPTGIRSRRNSCRNGTGKNIILVSRRMNATSIMSRTSLTCAGTSSAMRASPRRSTTSARIAGRSRRKMAGGRVGVIGTGATGVQLITEIAKEVAHLTVFQRTANYCAPLRNGPIDPETQRQIKASYPEIFKKCSETPGSFMHEFDPRSALDVSPDERLEQYERLWAEPGFKKWLANFHEVLIPGEANEDYAEFVRQKIRERVKDPVVAEKLVPKDHMFGSKRLPCESGYYEVYNQDNVVLVDVREAPIERITPTGVKTRDDEYELDVIIFATGYDAVTGPLNRIEIRGEGGQSLKDKFAAGPRTYMGIQSAGFPHLFTINAASVGNFVRAAEPLVDWVSNCIGYVRDHQLRRIAPTPEAEAAWTQHVAEAGAKILRTQADSWFVGANIPGQARFLLTSPDSAPVMRAQRAEVAAKSYEGFLLQ